MFTPIETPSLNVRRRRRILGALSTAVLATTVVGVAGPAGAAPSDVPGGDFVEVKTVTREVEDQRFRPDPLERETDKLDVGETRVVEPGKPGIRDVTYVFTLHNGRVVHRHIKDQVVEQKPERRVVLVGTNVPDGVWDRLAQCESGGNWHINTGNGYYGGLQFSLGTWHGYGGTGLPSDHSRETQIAIATKLRNAQGGYGAWPACSAKLGLPQ